MQLKKTQPRKSRVFQRIHISITTIAIGGCIVLFILLQKSCERESGSRKDFDTLAHIHFRDSSELSEKTNKLGQTTVTAQAYELSQKNLDRYVSENSDLKNKLSNSYRHVNSVNETATNFHIDTIKVPVPVHDTIPCADFDKSYPVLDKYYSFNFQFKNKHGHEPEYNFLNFNIPDTVIDVIGIKKSGFLNMKHAMVSEQVHTNKYIDVKGIKTVVKSEAQPNRFGIGASVGYGFQINSVGGIKANPYIGLSLNYSLIEF